MSSDKFGPRWAEPVPLIRGVARDFAVAQHADGHIEVFAIAKDGTLRHTYQLFSPPGYDQEFDFPVNDLVEDVGFLGWSTPAAFNVPSTLDENGPFHAAQLLAGPNLSVLPRQFLRSYFSPKLLKPDLSIAHRKGQDPDAWVYYSLYAVHEDGRLAVTNLAQTSTKGDYIWTDWTALIPNSDYINGDRVVVPIPGSSWKFIQDLESFKGVLGPNVNAFPSIAFGPVQLPPADAPGLGRFLHVIGTADVYDAPNASDSVVSFWNNTDVFQGPVYSAKNPPGVARLEAVYVNAEPTVASLPPMADYLTLDPSEPQDPSDSWFGEAYGVGFFALLEDTRLLFSRPFLSPSSNWGVKLDFLADPLMPAQVRDFSCVRGFNHFEDTGQWDKWLLDDKPDSLSVFYTRLDGAVRAWRPPYGEHVIFNPKQKFAQIEMARNLSGLVSMFLIDDSGSVWQTRSGEDPEDNFAGKWLSPEEMGIHATKILPAMNLTGHLELFYLRPDGEIWHTWQIEPG